MDNAIRLSDALDIVYNMDVSDCKNAEDAVGKIYQAIGDLPNLDAVPVVRCRDCKWWGDDEHLATDNVKYCQFGRYMVGLNGYCVYGEVKQDA